MIAGRIKRYDFAALGSNFARAAKLLASLKSDTPAGRITVDDGLYVNVMEYDADQPWAPCDYEAHRKFADIQVVLSGAESAAWHDISGLKVKTPYSDEKDVMFYSGTGAVPSRIELVPGLFVLFFPDDGHNGKFAPVSGANSIRKAVVKVKL